MKSPSNIKAVNKGSVGQSFISSTSNISNRSSGGQRIKEQFIYELLGAQQGFKKQKNKENVTNLIELYRRLVQHYSERNDAIAIYFMDKIQSLSQEIPHMQQSNEKLTLSMARQAAMQAQSPDKYRFNAKQNTMTTPTHKYDPNLKKKQRSINAQIAIEVSKIKKRANARTILNNYYKQSLQNNDLVNNDLQQQRKYLQDKLQSIHHQSMMKTKNMTESLGGSVSRQ